MIDLSDGLLRDAGRVAAASGVQLDLDAGIVRWDEPLLLEAARALGERASAGGDRAVVTGSAMGDDASEVVRRWVLTGGEDHGLLATFSPRAELPHGFVRIGEVHKKTPARALVTMGGEDPGGLGGGGWDHFG